MDRIEEKLRLLKPLLPLRQWDFLRVQYLFEKDWRKRQELEALMDMLLAKHLPGLQREQILLPTPEAGELAGDYQVGQALYPDQPKGLFGVREPEWIRHCGIFGKTGSGKTTLTMNLINEISRHGKPFLIFDYKRNYRDLLQHPDFKDQDILIFTVGRNDVVPFFFNPKLRPPGVEEHVWIKQLAEIIEKVYLLGPGANDVFMESAHFDTFGEMKDRVVKQKKKARELLWWASVKRTLNAINYPGLGEMVNCSEGHSIPDLLGKKVILELDGLSASDQAFVIGALLLWIYHYRMRQPEREVLKHFIIIEEAHHLFLKTRQEEDIADVIMREIRELGEAMVIIDQHPSKMSVSALGNLATKFCLSLSLNQDVQAVANSMLLETDQRRYLAMLTLGHSICRTDRIVQPLLLRIPPFPLKKGAVTDEDLKTHMSKYSDLARPENPGIPRKSPIRDIQKDETPTPLGRILLENIALEPVLGLVQRFRKLGLKTAEGYKVLRELEDKGLITPSTVDGKRLYGLTTAGRNVLGLRLSQTGRGGVEHRYWVEAVKAHYLKQEGFTFLEKDDLDLVVESYQNRLAIQMETGKSDLQGNIMKLGRYRADIKFILATNRSTETRLKNLLRNLLVPDREAIQVAFVKDFLANPPSL
ncbi:hypothetical protein AAU61_21350 [Desulfocarbo indianensis]|nr:hypothetical protein AAU61_21350 [Desulfocarbo indianensis]